MPSVRNAPPGIHQIQTFFRHLIPNVIPQQVLTRPACFLAEVRQVPLTCGLVSVASYGVIGTTVATYYTSLATGSLSMIDTTVADTINSRKAASSSTSTSSQARTYRKNARKKTLANSRSRVAYLLRKIRRSRGRR